MSFIQFKIRTRKTKHFFRVFIFDTKKEMYDWSEKYSTNTGAKYWKEAGDWSARFFPYIILDISGDGKETMKNEIGTILFYSSMIGAGVSSHEILHASLHYDRTINGNKEAYYGSGDEIDKCPIEESLALANGDLNRKFTQMCYKHGVYK